MSSAGRKCGFLFFSSFSPLVSCFSLFLSSRSSDSSGLSECQQERECQCILNNLYLDVFVVIDDSAQMGTAGLFEVAANINSVFGYSQIRVGDKYADGRGVRTAVITYNSYSTVRSNLSDFQSTDELTSLVYSLKPNREATSNLQSWVDPCPESFKLLLQPAESCSRNAWLHWSECSTEQYTSSCADLRGWLRVSDRKIRRSHDSSIQWLRWTDD